jgi:uncharacterized lipoprotein YddW (UPF0748 family)
MRFLPNRGSIASEVNKEEKEGANLRSSRGALLRFAFTMRVPFLVILLLWMTACAEREREPELPAEPAPVEPAGTHPTALPRRALWVLAEGSQRVLEDPARIARLLEEASSAGITDLFVQIYRQGKSWFSSAHADDAPYREIQAARGGGAAALDELVAGAHERGIRVHGWFNALSLARNDRAPLLRRLGRDAVLVDRHGRSLLDYPEFDVPVPDRLHTRIGTPGIYLDPGAPGVIEYLERTVDDLLQAAPDLDGLHLDYIRHPLALPFAPGSRFDQGLDFGYGHASRERFEAESGRSFRRGDDWDDFRRERLNELVRRLGARLPESWEYSAAVFPWADRAYLVAMQDWRRWIDEEWMDFVVAMAYTRDDRLLRYLAHGLRGGIGGDRVWLGLGTWLLLSQPQRMQAQIDQALAAEPAGIVLFSYDALAEKAGSLEGIHWTNE